MTDTTLRSSTGGPWWGRPTQPGLMVPVAHREADNVHQLKGGVRGGSAGTGSTATGGPTQPEDHADDEADGINQLRGTGPYRVSPKKFSSQSRNIIMNIIRFFGNDGSCKTLTEVVHKTAAATGVSRSTVEKIKSQGVKSSEGVIYSPPPTARPFPITGQLDEFDRGCIRREILSFYEHGELPTISRLLEKVKTPPINFSGSRSSLYRIVRQMGFKYKKVESGRKYLMEREDIVATRKKYLREIKINRESSHPRPEVYLDETWINQNLSIERCWTTDDGSVGPKLKTGRGARFIILHAGGSEGFVPGALLMFRSKNGAKGDYHDAMDYPRFKIWFEEQLLPNIQKGSLIIMDNASYHSKIVNKAPTTSTKKADIINWLEANNILYDHLATKMKLLVLCKKNKDKQEYEIDNIAACHGHKVLRLPPYHCMFNPIELIWAQIKSEVKKKKKF